MILRYVLLGLVQGVTEWLPVSSSGHLVFLQHFFGISMPVFLDALLHFASMLVILVVFWKDVKSILLSLFVEQYKPYRKYLLFILVGSLPIVVLGLLLRHRIEAMFTGFGFLAYTFTFTGFVLLMSRFRVFKFAKLTLPLALVIGFAQAIALVPGISRSGMTLATCLLLGINKRDALRFSFLLALPALFGAFVLQLPGIASVELGAAFVGFITAFVFGIVALRLLLRVFLLGKLHYFALWCFLMAILVGLSVSTGI
ncbi:UDP-diphosphatase [Candidatus Woesearchaeota archaeon]|nr:MAG: UDP-diphosphatase [Candidatus Woesearchaeota archaeon]